jgi:tellurite resistance protein TehA-like permease
MPLGFGVFVGGFHLLWGLRTGAARHLALSALSMATGAAAVMLSGGSSDVGAGIYFIGFGALQLTIGIVLLTRFLSRHPRPQDVTDDA